MSLVRNYQTLHQFCFPGCCNLHRCARGQVPVPPGRSGSHQGVLDGVRAVEDEPVPAVNSAAVRRARQELARCTTETDIGRVADPATCFGGINYTHSSGQGSLLSHERERSAAWVEVSSFRHRATWRTSGGLGSRFTVAKSANDGDIAGSVGNVEVG